MKYILILFTFALVGWNCLLGGNLGPWPVAPICTVPDLGEYQRTRRIARNLSRRLLPDPFIMKTDMYLDLRVRDVDEKFGHGYGKLPTKNHYTGETGCYMFCLARDTDAPPMYHNDVGLLGLVRVQGKYDSDLECNPKHRSGEAGPAALCNRLLPACAGANEGCHANPETIGIFSRARTMQDVERWEARREQAMQAAGRKLLPEPLDGKLPIKNFFAGTPGCYLHCLGRNLGEDAVYGWLRDVNIAGMVRVAGRYEGMICRPHAYAGVDVSTVQPFKDLCNRFIPACARAGCWAHGKTGGYVGIPPNARAP